MSRVLIPVPKPEATGPSSGRSFPVGPAHDAAEREAERITTEFTLSTTPSPPPSISPDRGTDRTAGSWVSAGELPSSGGRRLDPPTANAFGQRFGTDYSRVRLHADGPSSRAVHGLQADALTLGEHIYLAADRFRPGTEAYTTLLTHELVHVAQQRPVPPEQRVLRRRRRPGTTGESGSDAERIRPDPALVESAAGGLLAAVRTGATPDRLRDLFLRLDPLTAEVVVRRVLPLLSQAEGALVLEAARAANEARERSTEESAPSSETTRERSLEPADEPSDPASRTTRPAAAMATRGAANEDPSSEAARAVGDLPNLSGEAVAERIEALFDALAEPQQVAEAGGPPEAGGEAEIGSTGNETPASAASTEAEVEGTDPSLVSAEGGGSASADDDYDAEVALAETAVIADELEQAGRDAQRRVRRAGAGARERLASRAEKASRSVRSQAESAATQLRIGFDGQQRVLETDLADARRSIKDEHRSQREAVVARASTAREHARREYREHTPRMRTVVTGMVTEATTFQSQMGDRGRQRNRSYASRARRMGVTRAMSYPNTHRGLAQANAAVQTAEATARDIEGREQDIVEAIDEITESLPDEIQEQGDQAVGRISSEGLPGLLESITRQEEGVLRSLDGQRQRALESLDRLQAVVRQELLGMRDRATAKLEENRQGALGEISGGLNSALDQLTAAEARAVRPLRTHTQQGVSLLREATEPDVETARTTADALITFLNAGAEEGATSLREAAASMATGFSKAETAASAAFTALEQTTSDGLGRLETQLSTKLKTLSEGTLTGLKNSRTAFDDSAKDTEKKISDELSKSRDDLRGDLRARIAATRPDVNKAISEGMAKNQEGLNDLPSAMREAASEAAWDHDHPVLAAIRDVAAIVAGVIVGLLLVIALVVVVIVGFKVLIAGLVAAGISLAVAKAIAVAIGVGMLAYGIYSTYRARVDAGLEAGPWDIIQDLTGISSIRQSFENPNLSPFQRGLAFGEGVGNLAAFVILRGKRAHAVDARINTMLPRGVVSPQRGSGLRSLLPQRFQRPTGLETRGYRPQPGERMTTRDQWRAQDRSRRLAEREAAGLPPPPERPPRTAPPTDRTTAPQPQAPATSRPTSTRTPVPSGARSPSATGPATPTRENVVSFPERRPPQRRGLETRGTRPEPGSRSQTREQYQAGERARRARASGGRPNEGNLRSIFRDRQGQPHAGPEPPTRGPNEGRLPVPQEQPVAQAAGAERYRPIPLETPRPPTRRPQVVAAANAPGGRPPGARPPAGPATPRHPSGAAPAGPTRQAPMRQAPGPAAPHAPRPSRRGRQPAAADTPETTVQRIRERLGGRLRVQDTAVDRLTTQQADEILRGPIPPESKPIARDIYKYLRYRSSNPNAQYSYRAWTRRFGLRQRQRAAARAAGQTPRESRQGDLVDDLQRSRPSRPLREPTASDVRAAEDLKRGPRTTADAAEEAAHTSSLDERVGRHRTEESQLSKEVGTHIEHPEVQTWARELSASDVYAKNQFDAVDWLKAAFPDGRARPDLIGINPRSRRILVGDSTSQPNADHIAKTFDYARQLVRNLPQRFRGWRVEVFERYYGIPQGEGRNGPRRLGTVPNPPEP